MDLTIFQVAFAPKSGEDKPTVVPYVASTLVDAMNYAKSFDGSIIGIQEVGSCVLCGSLVEFE